MNTIGQDIAAMARVEAERMKAAVANAQPNVEIAMSSAQFARLADLIAALAEPVEPTPPVEPAESASTTWAADSFNDTRHWVPLDHFRRVKAQADMLQAAYDRLTGPKDDFDFFRH
ncbi:hypothetical protein LWE61_13410 [Sphingobium sufflavum]|uniref:hypothetical protein n=1 Tax=Sphingobium sufflavum TaxID=1129547 RepID=UPI001F3AD6C3|nr:hypothetical protein [Sphingobium sufflavum]MCE7797545.1 hypothetical protein [Sphingobium sufflavum]